MYLCKIVPLRAPCTSSAVKLPTPVHERTIHCVKFSALYTSSPVSVIRCVACTATESKYIILESRVHVYTTCTAFSKVNTPQSTGSGVSKCTVLFRSSHSA